MSLSDLQQCLAGYRQLLVAYSGGLDSSVLLHQLVCLRRQHAFTLRAIHIHHGLNPLADGWAEHCQQQCAQWQVALEIVRVQVDGREKGIEAAAREARYRAFRQHLQPDECLLTAQHLDDQCETLLLALKRGSGPAGLAAMPVSAEFGSHRHLRPLLTQTRMQLEQWAGEHQLDWIEDDSNQDTRYDRNFLRQVILPELSARWPHFAQAAARSATLCGEQEQLLDELLAESLSTLVDEKGSLAIMPLMAMSEYRRAALLRRWIARRQGLMPSRDALARLWLEVACSREDAQPRLRLGKAEVRRFRDRLYWLPHVESVRNEALLWPETASSLLLPEGLGRLIRGDKGTAVRAPQAGETVSVRFQAQGKFHIVGRAGSRPLKKLWQELGVAPWLRDRTPLLFYNEQLIAAVGVFITREGERKEQQGWQICWQQDEQ